MRNAFKSLRLKQLDLTVGPLRVAGQLPRPQRGWLRAIREAAGIPASELARTLGVSRQLPLQLEKWEAADRITLRSLRRVADALDCDLVYALVPRAGTMQGLIDNRARVQATKNVLGVEHSMALEDQAAGGIEEAIEVETRRLAGKRSQR